MGSNSETSIAPEPQLVLGSCLGCGWNNQYSPRRLGDYREKGWKLSPLCTKCLFERRATTFKQPDGKAKAKAKTFQDTGTMTDPAPYAEEAEKLAVIKAEGACPKMEELKAPAKAVKDVLEVVEAAHKAKEVKAEESAVIQAEEDCLKREADEGAAVKEIGVVRCFAAIMVEEACLKAEEQKTSAKAVEDTEEAAGATHKAKEEKAEESAVIRAEVAHPKAEADKRPAAEKTGVVTRAAAKAKAAADKAKEEADRLAHDAETARRAEHSSAAKLKAARPGRQ